MTFISAILSPKNYNWSVGYNEFDFIKKLRTQTLRWVQKTHLLNTFLDFGAIFCAFGFKVLKSNNMTQKISLG